MADVEFLLQQVLDEFKRLKDDVQGTHDSGNGNRMSGEEVSAAQDAEVAKYNTPVAEAPGQDTHASGPLDPREEPVVEVPPLEPADATEVPQA